MELRKMVLAVPDKSVRHKYVTKILLECHKTFPVFNMQVTDNAKSKLNCAFLIAGDLEVFRKKQPPPKKKSLQKVLHV